MNADESAAIEQAALHLATVIQRIDDRAQFTAATEADLSRISAELPLSDELVAWYRTAAPASDVYIGQFGNDLRIAGIHGLLDAQSGYRWKVWPPTKQSERFDDWPTNWIVIADEGADPLIADTSSPGTPILKDMHGMGRWDPWLLAPTLAAYLEAQARWIEICLIQSGAIDTAWEKSPWNNDGHLLPEVERQLRAALSSVLPEECLTAWL